MPRLSQVKGRPYQSSQRTRWDAPPEPGEGRFLPLVHVELDEGGVEGEVAFLEEPDELHQPPAGIGD